MASIMKIFVIFKFKFTFIYLYSTFITATKLTKVLYRTIR